MKSGSNLLSVIVLIRTVQTNQHNLPVWQLHMLPFSFQHGVASEQSPSCCMMRRGLWLQEDQWNSDFTHMSYDINTENIHLYLMFECPPDLHLAHVMNLQWLLSCRGSKDPDTLRRTWFADNQVKTGMGFLPLTLCFSVEHHNVVGCPAERERM